MTWTQLRGRPVAMPCDPTPLRGGHIDTQTRVAWLLRTNRLAGGLGTAPSFATALAAHGAVVGPSALSRYETGGESAPPRVIRAYELALDLPAGQLVGVSQGLRRMFGPTPVPGVLPELSRTAISEALGGLETRVADGTSTGLDWLAIAQLLTCSSGMQLPPSMLTDWVGRLVGQTMRSVHHAYTTRLQALSLLVADPQTCRLVWDQIQAETGRPGAQGVADVLAVLGDVRDPGLVRRLLQRLAETEGAGHRSGAADPDRDRKAARRSGVHLDRHHSRDGQSRSCGRAACLFAGPADLCTVDKAGDRCPWLRSHRH